MGPWKPNKVEQISTQRGYENFTSGRTNKNEGKKQLERGEKTKQNYKSTTTNNNNNDDNEEGQSGNTYIHAHL